MTIEDKEIKNFLISRGFVSAQYKNNAFGITSSVRYFQSYHGYINDHEVIVNVYDKSKYCFNIPFIHTSIEFSTIEKLMHLFNSVR